MCLLYYFAFSMLSQLEIKSLVRIQADSNQEQEAETSTLDLSHQQLRKLKEIELTQLNVSRINASYNYFKDYNDLNIKQINDRLQVPFEYLDISFNFFKTLDQSAEASHLLKYLKYLNISANRIQSLDFTHLTIPRLQTLIINNNKLQYFINCPNTLKVLSLNDNLLTTLAFSGGQNLNALSAINNRIKKIAFELPQLIILDLQTNLVQDMQMLKQSIVKSKELMSINFRQNPVSKFKNYKVMILQSCQNITQIDELIINPHIRQGFKMLKSEQKLNEMLDNINSKYALKLLQKQKIKQELIHKIRQKEKIIENRFEQDMQQQKKEIEILQNQAKSILAKNKYGISNQKKDFQKVMKDARHGEQQNDDQNTHLNTVQRKHFDQYLQYLKKNKVAQPLSRNRDLISQHSSKVSKLSHSNLSIESDVQFQNLKLFDPRCIEPLVNEYTFNG